jgi:hypothetical protein
LVAKNLMVLKLAVGSPLIKRPAAGNAPGAGFLIGVVTFFCFNTSRKEPHTSGKEAGEQEMNGETNKHRWIRGLLSIAASSFLFLAVSPLVRVWAGDSVPRQPDDLSNVETASAPWQATATSGDELGVAWDATDLAEAAADTGTNVQIDGTYGLPGAATHIDTATDSSGNIYAVYEYLDGADYDLIVAKSADSGATWTLYSLGGSGDERHPAIAIDASDHVSIATDYTSGSNTYPAFCKSTNPGDISGWTCGYFGGLSDGSQNPAIATYGGGDTATIYMVWQYRSGSVYTLRYFYSTDGGGNWTTVLFSPGTYSRLYPAVALSKSGVSTLVSLVYQYDYPGDGDVYVINEVAGSDSWNMVLSYTSFRREAYPTLAASGSNVYFAYQYNERNNNDDIHFRYSTDGGQSYSASDIVLAGVGNRNERYPSLAAQGTDVRAAYVFGGDTTYLRLSTSAYGASWGDPYTMNDAGDTTEEGFRAVDVSYLYDAHPAVAWIDNRNSGTDYDPYFATLNDGPLAPTQSSPFDNEKTADTAPEFTFGAADSDADTLSYQIQIDDSHDFGSPLVDRDSSIDGTGFSGSDPYASGSDVTYTYQATDPALSDGATYYWRVRTKDLIGSRSDWSATWSYTIDTSDSTVAWLQTTQEQFDTGAHDDTEALSDDVQLALPQKSGAFTSPVIGIADFGGGAEWGEIHWADSESDDTRLKLHVYYDVSGVPTIIPDAALPGNSAGFGGNFIDLTGLDAVTYDKLYLRAELDTTDNKVTPVLHEWAVRKRDTSPSSQTVVLFISTSAGQRYTFGQTGVTIEFPSDAPDAACTISVAVDRNASAGDNVSRQYAIDTDCTGFSATLTLGYTQVELNGNDENAMSVYRSHGGGPWQEVIPSSRDTNANTLTVENVAEFSDWQMGDTPPTAVSLASFAAEWDGDEVQVAWETVLEIDTVGFNLWRSTDPDDGYERVDGALIPAESLGGVEGGFYEYTDGDVTPSTTYYYKLEELEVGGASNWYGPVPTGAQAPTAVTISSFAAHSLGNPALVWWLVVGMAVVGVSGALLTRRR